MEFPLFITKHFSFAAFKVLSLSLFLFIFIIICLSLSLWVQVIWNSLGSLDLDVYFLPKIMVWGQTIFYSNVLWPSLFFAILDHYKVNASLLDVVPKVPQSTFTFFNSFFLFCSKFHYSSSSVMYFPFFWSAVEPLCCIFQFSNCILSYGDNHDLLTVFFLNFITNEATVNIFVHKSWWIS